MGAESQRPKGREGTILVLNTTIEALNLAKELSSITPAKAVFGSVSIILTTIKDAMINQADYVELGLACSDVCTTLDRGLNGKKLNDLNNSVCEAIKQLTTAVGEIQGSAIKQARRNVISRHLHAKNDKEKIAVWKSDLNRILQVFNTELTINTHMAVSEIHDGVVNTHAIVSGLEHKVSDIHRTIMGDQEGSGVASPSTQTRKHGESPPPAPRACFGRGELIEKVISLAENLAPIALIGAGGIGKTSIALTVLHHDHIKQRFGDDRRFIRCDHFPASCTHLLSRLSEVVGAGIENPEDLAPLRPFLSSKEVLIILDNAESILDPRGTDAREIYAIVEELSQLETVCLCITSRISTVPPDCETIDIPTLSIDAARDAFYRIYKSVARSDHVDKILDELDFHPLSITLLATVGHQSKWNPDRLGREWEKRRTSMLQTEHNTSLAAAIEVSLTSPLFQELGPDARGLLEVVAFFPQGVNENNLDWLFPSIPNRAEIFDKFCILSLTYRSGGFSTMLAPLRDYLSPKDPRSSALLCTTKEHYFSRMSVNINPSQSSFGESQWITSEDVNVEHLLNIFTMVDADSDDVWEACAKFMVHLYWHKTRLVILQPRIEGLPDDHHYKSRCLFHLSRLFGFVGNWAENRRLLIRVLKLQRDGQESDHQVAITMMNLSDANWFMGLHKEGIEAVKEALELFERLGDTAGQAGCLIELARLFCSDGQFDAAEAAFRAISILPEEGEEYRVCGSHRGLSEIYQSKGEIEKAIHHFELALGIASSFNWHDDLFGVHYNLAGLFRGEGRLDDAQTHVEHAKLHVVNSAYNLGYVTEEQASVWYEQDRLEEAKSEALCAAEIYEKLGAAKALEECRELLRGIEEELNASVSSGQLESDSQGTE